MGDVKQRKQRAKRTLSNNQTPVQANEHHDSYTKINLAQFPLLSK